jgi:hypothetical protein
MFLYFLDNEENIKPSFVSYVVIVAFVGLYALGSGVGRPL